MVYHSTNDDGVRIGNLVDRDPELNEAFMKLPLSDLTTMSTSTPKTSRGARILVEVDGKSSGLFNLLTEETALFKPEQLLAHPDIPFFHGGQTTRSRGCLEL